MPQNPFGGPQPLGSRLQHHHGAAPTRRWRSPQFYGFQGKREARIGSVCVTGSGLQAAVFCDIVDRFYTPGPPRNANQCCPVGLAAVDPLPPDPPMVRIAVDGKYDAHASRR